MSAIILQTPCCHAVMTSKKISSLYGKNATIVLQVLQKILSLRTSGQEKKACGYKSTVLMLQVGCI